MRNKTSLQPVSIPEMHEQFTVIEREGSRSNIVQDTIGVESVVAPLSDRSYGIASYLGTQMEKMIGTFSNLAGEMSQITKGNSELERAFKEYKNQITKVLNEYNYFALILTCTQPCRRFYNSV